MRGKHPAGVIRHTADRGSSPHARETPGQHRIAAVHQRLIPACAGNTYRHPADRRRWPAHPRMRGKHALPSLNCASAAGSSPHARETLRQSVRPSFRRRLIPACAGNTATGAQAALGQTAHPRMRGKHLIVDKITGGAIGSSPHARETQTAHHGHAGMSRLIPACAGNTRSESTKSCTRPAHPRMRGKHERRRRADDLRAGSSPHARETRERAWHLGAGRRLIPACAGNTVALVQVLTSPTAHPRMRGKHGARRLSHDSFAGSSPHARETPRQAQGGGKLPTAHPRMRGKHRARAAARSAEDGSSPHARETHELEPGVRHQQRLIPACAGNTRASYSAGGISSAHPRMRGKHSKASATPTRRRGSSPHARETRVDLVGQGKNDRLIPACAGNTYLDRRRRSRPPAHPRMRGKHVRAPGRRHLYDGSSPHARETPRRLRPRCSPRRLIPACAGNTSIVPHHRRINPAHPRMRGKHYRLRRPHVQRYGSSPHARETPAAI